MAEANGNGTARLTLIVTACGVAVVLIGALMTLYVQVNTAYQTANDLKDRVERQATELADDRNEIGMLCSDLKEVETQFKSADQTRNIMHANDLRVQAMLWQRAFKSAYPTDNAYYPTIAQEQPTPCR